jgi:hypothetical protein
MHGRRIGSDRASLVHASNSRNSFQTCVRGLVARYARVVLEFFAPENKGRGATPKKGAGDPKKGAGATLKRGRGECRAPGAPAASCAKRVGRNAHEYSQRVHRNHPAFPHAMVLRLTSSSPRRSGFLASVAPEKLASQELDASVETSGPHDLAVRNAAPSSEAPLASTASRPASVTIAIRPLCGTRRQWICR